MDSRKSPPQSGVSVEQADREAANALLLGPLVAGGDGGTYVVRTPSLQQAAEAFARHRLSAATPADGVLREALEHIKALDQVPKHHVFRIEPTSETLDGPCAAIARKALSAAPKAPTAPIGEAGEGLRQAAQALLDFIGDKGMWVYASDPAVKALRAALSPSAGAERPRASQFIGWIADRFVEKHNPPLDRNKALAMAWATLDCAESDGCVFGHPGFDWARGGANALADEDIELWEPAP